MRWQEALHTAVEGLHGHLLRSLLTALGIIFGVAAVIAMLSIGEGARQESLEQIQQLGIRNIIVDDVAIEDGNEGEGRSNLSRGLDLADARAIEETHPLIDIVLPERTLSSTVRYRSESQETTVVGTTPDLITAHDLSLALGRFFDFDELDHARRVCVLGAELRRRLFFLADPVGTRIQVGDQWFTVIGVLSRRALGVSTSGSEPHDPNLDLFVPLSCARLRFTHEPFESELSRITVRVADADHVAEEADLLARTLRRRHGDVEDHRIVVPEALLRQRQATQRIFNIVMGAIAGISLLVGGIGIMNIMLASVLERTREIGIRRAIGATRRDILTQFLVEATVVSLAGGVVGILLGFLLARTIAHAAGWNTAVSISSILLAFGVSATVGIVFGWVPARRAARLDPIESLRYE